MRRPIRARRGADDGDSARRAEERPYLGVGGERDRPAALLEVEDGARPIEITARLGQVCTSLAYGLPTAAGAMLRPTTPARTMIVST